MSDHEERVDQAISITERHPNKAKILPTITDSSDDNSPVLNKTFDDENSDSASSTSSSSSDDDDSNTVGIIATEAQRKRRIRCFMVLSFLPFVAAFLATGGFIAMRQNSNEDATKLSEDGGKSSGATATEATSFSMLRTSSPTASPHAAKQQYGPKQQLDYDSTASSDDGMSFIAKATTATTATSATTTTTTTTTATTPITISTSDNTVEETTHGNLRSTMSPTPALTKVTTTSPTTASPTTASPTTASPTTAPPTTASPTTASPTTASPITASPITASPTTASPTTASPTTASPITASPITASSTTASPTTASPTTASPTTASPTTASPTTALPTASPTTASPTTAPTTASPTTLSPTTASPTTSSPTTASPTTASPTTLSPTTVPPTTTRPTTSFPVVVSMDLVDIGNDGEPWADFPLGECQGDCDGDDECEGSLVCFSRSNDEPVPGCNGDGTTGTDYCFQRPSTNYLYSPLDKFPLGLCEGDCDDDDDCEGDLICEQRSGFDEITGCVGRGAENDDYCRVATEETPVTPFPSTVESTACVSSGEYCSEDGNACCSGKCKKDKDTGEEVCVDEEGPEVTDNLRATISPTVAPVTSSPTCVRGGELCPDDKNICCSGKCEKDKDTKQKVCTSDLVEASFEIGMDLCSAAGEPCTDKNMCCSGECKKADKKAERENDIGQERKKDDNVCG